MDHVVDDYGGIDVISVVGAKRAKPCNNTSLSKAFDSPRKIKSRASSNESVYEVVAELDNEESEYEACNSEDEDNLDKNNSIELNGLETCKNNHIKVDDPSDPVEMEEYFVIEDDDGNDVLDGKTESHGKKSGEEKLSLSNGKDFTQEKKQVPQLSDNEDEMDSILDEFAETQCNDFRDDEKSDSKVILSSEGEDEMECLLEEFSKENGSDEDSTVLKLGVSINVNTFSTNQCENSSQNVSNTCDIEIDDYSASNDQLNTSYNDKNESMSGIQQTCNVQKCTDSLRNKNCSSIKTEVVIVSDTDEKSNISDCSSIEILLDDSSVKGADQNLCKMAEKASFSLSSVTNDSPSSVSGAEKFDFERIVMDIADEDTSEKQHDADIISPSELPVIVSSDSKANTPLITFASESFKDASSISISTNENDNTIQTNSEAVTDNQIKNFKCKENISVNNTSSEFVPSSLNILNNVDNHSDAVSETPKDENISMNSVIPTLMLEDAPSLSNENNSCKRKAISDTIEEGKDINISEEVATLVQCKSSSEVISSGDGEKDNDKKIVHDDIQNTCIEKGDNDLLNNVSSINDTDSLEEKNEIAIDKQPVQLETSNEFKVAENQESEKIKEGVKEESEPEGKRIKLDTEECSTIAHTQIECNELPDTKLLSMNKDASLVSNSVVSLNTSSGELVSAVDDTNKRKLEVTDLDTDVKKFKSENSNYLNDDESSASSASGDFAMKNTSIENLVSDVTVADYKAVDKINSLMPWNPTEKIETTNAVLDRISMHICQEVVKECFKKKYLEGKNKVKELEDKISSLSKNLETFRTQFAEFRENQKKAFFQQNFKSKPQTRTVGVNVKIYRESEVKQALNVQNIVKNQPLTPVKNPNAVEEKPSLVVTKTENPPPASNIKVIKAGATFVPSTQLKDTVITPVLSQQQINVRKQLLPRIIAQTNRNMVGPQVMTPLQRIPPPNVTVTGNPLIPIMNSASRPSSTHSVVLVPSSKMTSASRNSLIDLTKEEQARNAANGTSIPTTTVAKVTVPGMANNPNVLVPLRDYLQLLPGSKGPAVIQQSQVPRQTIIPPLPSNLIGARTVTYIVPQNSGLGRGMPQFLQPNNQQVQFVLRVTTPGSTPTLSPVVNTISRAPSVPQLPMSNTISRAPSVPQLPMNTGPRASSGLILVSHTSKHPAPFPKSPNYTDTKGKAIPPKPSLKGSKNTNGGIVLSWNMCLFRHHANVSSYQLFAYQETDGPVDASLWKKVGDVNALPLPMACTLTQFVDKNRYYFTVRAVDVHQRFGPFSDPVSILYDKDGDSSSKK